MHNHYNCWWHLLVVLPSTGIEAQQGSSFSSQAAFSTRMFLQSMKNSVLEMLIKAGNSKISILRHQNQTTSTVMLLIRHQIFFRKCVIPRIQQYATRKISMKDRITHLLIAKLVPKEWMLTPVFLVFHDSNSLTNMFSDAGGTQRRFNVRTRVRISKRELICICWEGHNKLKVFYAC